MLMNMNALLLKLGFSDVKVKFPFEHGVQFSRARVGVVVPCVDNHIFKVVGNTITVFISKATIKITIMSGIISTSNVINDVVELLVIRVVPNCRDCH